MTDGRGTDRGGALRPDNRELGRLGENAACEFLKAGGYEIVERNWRVRSGEIDIIARRDRMTVFVEVKARSGGGFGLPEESVTPAKANRIRLLATEYLSTAGVHGEVRFDVIAVMFGRDGTLREVLDFTDAF